MSDVWDPSDAELDVMREFASRVRPVGHFTSHPFGQAKMAAKLISQRKFWVNASNEQIRISEMEPDYLFATMAWLLKRASTVKLMLELYYEVSKSPKELIERLSKYSSEEFMRQTPLFCAMRERYLKEEVEPNFFTDDDDD